MSLTGLDNALRCGLGRALAAPLALLLAVAAGSGCRGAGLFQGPVLVDAAIPPATAASCTSASVPDEVELAYRPELGGCAVLIVRPEYMPASMMNDAEARHSFEWLRKIPHVRELQVLSPFIPLLVVEWFPELRRLFLTSRASQDLHALKKMPRLVHLEFRNFGDGCPDLDTIGGLSQLRELAVVGVTCKTLAPLGSLQHLERLNVDHVTTHDLGVFRDMPRLRDLELDYHRLEDAHIDAPGLRGLTISASDGYDAPLDLADIAGLDSLESLVISGAGSVKSPEMLARFLRLRRLTVQVYDAPQMLEYARALPALEYLDVSHSVEIGANLTSMGPIIRIKALRHLVIYEGALRPLLDWLCKDRPLERLEVFHQRPPRDDRDLEKLRACRPDLDVVIRPEVPRTRRSRWRQSRGGAS